MVRNLSCKVNKKERGFILFSLKIIGEGRKGGTEGGIMGVKGFFTVSECRNFPDYRAEM